MKYLCLRDCFVNSRLWREGQTYNLPDTMKISPKNFKPVKLDDEQEAPPAPEAPTPEPPANELVCHVCGKECKSAFGLQSHMRSHDKEVDDGTANTKDS
jgi:hypothetical protein